MLDTVLGLGDATLKQNLQPSSIYLIGVRKQ